MNVPARTALAISERAYEESSSSTAWLEGIVESADALFRRAHVGVLASTFRADVPEGIRVIDVASLSVDADDYRGIIARTESDVVSAIFAPGPIVEVSKRIHRDHPSWQALEARGILEIAGFVCRDSGSMGCNVAFNLTSRAELTAVERRRLARAAVHVTAGLRLLHRNGPEEAVLAPDGRLLDARGQARDKALQERLRRAALELDRSRTRTADADAVLEAWPGLVAGRWSLVLRFDSDGRRFWIARENAPEQVPARALDAVEQRVVGYLALGHSQKLIAYELGMTESKVSRLSASIRRKLGVRSNAELIDLRATLVGPGRA